MAGADADDAGDAGDVPPPPRNSLKCCPGGGVRGGVTGKEVRSISYVQHAACCRRILRHTNMGCLSEVGHTQKNSQEMEVTPENPMSVGGTMNVDIGSYEYVSK